LFPEYSAYGGACHSNFEEEVVDPSEGKDCCGGLPAKTVSGIKNIIRAEKIDSKNLKAIFSGRKSLKYYF